MRSLLFGVEPLDPPSLLAAALILAAAAAIVASFAPLRRAARVDATTSMRSV